MDLVHKKRALVAGGAGFLGSHLVDRLLAEGFEVLAMDDFSTGSKTNIEHLKNEPNFRFVEQDVCNPIETKAKFDYIFHFASPASPQDFERIPLQVMRAGSIATFNLIERAKQDRSVFFMASTSEVYGDPVISPQPETYWGNVNSIGPRSVYDEAKRFSEALTMAYHRHEGVDVRIVRFFNTYGPRMRLDDGRVVPNFIYQALENKPLTVYGEGTQTRSFGYYEDSIEGVYRLARSSYQLPVNIGSQSEFTVIEFAKKVIELADSQSEIIYLPPLADDPQQRRPDTSRAKKELNWSPQWKIEDGLRETIASFRLRM